MNILFLNISMQKTEVPGMYEGLLREFIKHGDSVYVATAVERRTGKKTLLSEYNGMKFLEVATGNITGNVNIIEKGFSTVLVDNIFQSKIQKYFHGVRFELIIYPTPPITFVKTISWIKKRDNAKAYLLLKDIFPQNAVDLGMMKKTGIRGFLYKYFRNKEKKLYRISDYIGCMSPANCEYVLNHNTEVKREKVEVCPNCVIPLDKNMDDTSTRESIRKKYELPIHKTIFVYGGNLGKPQGIEFLLECINECKNVENAFFLIVGSGAEAIKVEKFIKEKEFLHARYIKQLPKEEYAKLVRACDVGLVFLDYRFTIPNFPSRILSYMQAAMPVIVATDPNTDMGDIVVENDFGWKCYSNNTKAFSECVINALSSNLNRMGKNARCCLKENYTVVKGYEIIMSHFK